MRQSWQLVVRTKDILAGYWGEEARRDLEYLKSLERPSRSVRRHLFGLHRRQLISLKGVRATSKSKVVYWYIIIIVFLTACIAALLTGAQIPKY